MLYIKCQLLNFVIINVVLLKLKIIPKLILFISKSISIFDIQNNKVLLVQFGGNFGDAQKDL